MTGHIVNVDICSEVGTPMHFDVTIVTRELGMVQIDVTTFTDSTTQFMTVPGPVSRNYIFSVTPPEHYFEEVHDILKDMLFSNDEVDTEDFKYLEQHGRFPVDPDIEDDK